jgi:hypothetical protein
MKGHFMLLRFLKILPVGIAIASAALAQESNPWKNTVEPLRDQGYSVGMVIPIFGQLLKFSVPKGFKPVVENTAAGQYINELVPDGETVKKWSQMITITGTKGLAQNPKANPQILANIIASGFKKACPDSYNAVGLGAIKLNGGYDAFGAVISCGFDNSKGDPFSETVLAIVIRGESDYYTVQWAERGDPSRVPIKYDETKWTDRVKKLAPIKLCPIVPGELAPYPSCVERK